MPDRFIPESPSRAARRLRQQHALLAREIHRLACLERSAGQAPQGAQGRPTPRRAATAARAAAAAEWSFAQARK